MLVLLICATSPIWILALASATFYLIAPRRYWPGQVTPQKGE